MLVDLYPEDRVVGVECERVRLADFEAVMQPVLHADLRDKREQNVFWPNHRFINLRECAQSVSMLAQAHRPNNRGFDVTTMTACTTVSAGVSIFHMNIHAPICRKLQR